MDRDWMSTSEVCKEIGTNRDWIYGLYRKGYIQPRKMRRRRNRYLFSKRDVEVMRRAWAYWVDGYKLDVAWEKGMAEYDEPRLPGLG